MSDLDIHVDNVSYIDSYLVDTNRGNDLGSNLDLLATSMFT